MRTEGIAVNIQAEQTMNKLGMRTSSICTSRSVRSPLANSTGVRMVVIFPFGALAAPSYTAQR